MGKDMKEGPEGEGDKYEGQICFRLKGSAVEG